MAEFTQTTYPVDPEAGKDPLKAETVEQIENIISSSPSITEINEKLSIETTRLHQDDVIYYSNAIYATHDSSNNITVMFSDEGSQYNNLYYKLNGVDYTLNLTTLNYTIPHNYSLVLNTQTKTLQTVDTNKIDRNKHLTLITNHRGVIKHTHLFVMWYPNYQIGTSAPTSTPKFVGQEFIDTTNKKVYRAMGTSGSSDWIALN